ncbi:MAG: hypothetical protein II811_08475, partial [Spirochaetaceae bacterium]|nr:hypothetical protein [Spirochaetaceae bacterium]
FGGLKFRGSYNVGNRTANRVTTDQNNVSLLEGNLQAKGVYSVGKNVGKATESWSWSGAKGYGNSGKLGINKNLAGNFDGTAVGADIDNMDLNITAGKTLAWGLEYGLKDALPGDLTLMAYLLSNKEDESVTTNDDGDTTTVLNSQYAFKADYNQSDLFRVTFDGKVAHQKMAFGLFFSPQMVENLALTFGGTIALDKSGIYDDDYGVDDDVMYWGVDFRARYAFSEAMAATFYANISGMNKSTPTEANADGTYSAGDAKTALDVIGNFTYGLNDLAKLFVEVEYAALSLDSDDAKVAVAKTTLVGQFGAILTAGKGATLTPALRLTLMGLGMDKDSGYSQGMLISVPVVMRVQL